MEILVQVNINGFQTEVKFFNASLEEVLESLTKAGATFLSDYILVAGKWTRVFF